MDNIEELWMGKQPSEKSVSSFHSKNLDELIQLEDEYLELEKQLKEMQDLEKEEGIKLQKLFEYTTGELRLPEPPLEIEQVKLNNVYFPINTKDINISYIIELKVTKAQQKSDSEDEFIKIFQKEFIILSQFKNLRQFKLLIIIENLNSFFFEVLTQSALIKLHQLIRLEVILSACSIGNRGLLYLPGMIQAIKNLQYLFLNLESNWITPEGISYLNQMIEYLPKHLKTFKLNLCNNKIKSDGLKLLSQAYEILPPSLVYIYLNLADNDIDENGAKQFSKTFKSFPSGLETLHLNFTKNYLDNMGTYYIINELQIQVKGSIKDLSLLLSENMKLRDCFNALQKLMFVLGSQNLIRIELKFNKTILSSELLKSFSEAMCQIGPATTELYLSFVDCDLEGVGMHYLFLVFEKLQKQLQRIMLNVLMNDRLLNKDLSKFIKLFLKMMVDQYQLELLNFKFDEKLLWQRQIRWWKLLKELIYTKNRRNQINISKVIQIQLIGKYLFSFIDQKYLNDVYDNLFSSTAEITD